MHRIREFSDSDPGQAIADLEEVVGLKIPGIETDAVALLRDIRGRMETISADLEAGERAWVMGKVQEAMDSWNRVLSVFPQHRSVCEKAQQAQQVLVEIESLKNASRSSLEAARFAEAQDLLRGAVSRFPGADELRSLLAKVPGLMDEYRNALAAAKEMFQGRALVGALASLDLALSVAPKSEEALRLHEQTNEGLDQVRDLLDRARADLDSALFPIAFGCIEQARTVQTDAPGIESLLREATERRAGYNDSFFQGSTAFESGDLERCLLVAQAALSFCPASEEAATLVRVAEERMESCRALLEGVETHLKAAEFDRVISDLNSVKEEWACCPSLGDLQKKAEKMQSSYAAFMDSARRALRKRDRNGFCGAVDAALGLCPDSQEAKDLSLRPPPEPLPPWNPDLSWLFRLVGWGGLIAGVCWLVYTLVLAAAAGAKKVWLVNLEDPFPLFLSFLVLTAVSGIVNYVRSPYRLPIDRFASSFILPLAVNGGCVGLVTGEVCHYLVGLDVPNAIIAGMVASNLGALIYLLYSFRAR
jgi:tetratricopeptide (TPR) repeat protein